VTAPPLNCRRLQGSSEGGVSAELDAGGADAGLVTDMADRVVVVQNDNSVISRAIAQDYARRRGVGNVVSVQCPDAASSVRFETIDAVSYRQQIESPLRWFLAKHPGIDFIVLRKGIPLRLTGIGEAHGIDRFSLASHLATLDYDQMPNAVRVEILQNTSTTRAGASYSVVIITPSPGPTDFGTVTSDSRTPSLAAIW